MAVRDALERAVLDCLEQTAMNHDIDLSDLIPGYLARRRVDVVVLQGALARRDFATIARTGHTMKGSGAGYGFPQLSALGGELERAGESRDLGKAQRSTRALDDYLTSLDSPEDGSARKQYPTPRTDST